MTPPVRARMPAAQWLGETVGVFERIVSATPRAKFAGDDPAQVLRQRPLRRFSQPAKGRVKLPWPLPPFSPPGGRLRRLFRHVLL